ncbi:MAG: hypothetical protein ACRC7G_09335 [Beijerinckiaceae bacterium]
MKHLLTLSAAAMVMAAVTPAAAGGQGCVNCYQKVVSPPVYRTVHETVQVRPAQTVAHVSPAQYGTVHEKVVVRPGHTIARTIPAEHGVVAETVMVSPARKEWQVTVDAHGRKIGCWVTVPAQYATHHRTVVTRPASVVHHHVPAVYGVRAHTVVTRPSQVHHQVIPAEYATRQRHEMVAPPTASWQPIGGRGYRHY